MHIHQMDVVTAFLNGILEEEVYIKQPDGFMVSGQEGKVCRLHKALYGLKQSPRCWNTVLHDFLVSMAFVRSSADPCVYISWIENHLTIIAVYVDDLLIMGDTELEVVRVKNSLSKRFEMKDLGVARYCLGFVVEQTDECLKIHQKPYIEEILNRFQMDRANSVSTPMDLNVKLLKSDDVSKPVDSAHYQAIVGSLLYLAIGSRPDIAHAVSEVAKFSIKPNEAHMTAVKRILRYLRGSLAYQLIYRRHGSLIGYTDADWAGDRDSRHSTSGYCFLMGDGAVTWKSKRQNVVATSTAEAEYIALYHGTQEAIWISRLLVELKLTAAPVCIKVDNQSAISIANNPINSTRMKHIDIKFHFIREAIIKQQILTAYCPTDVMTADILTKALARDRFHQLRRALGLVDPRSVEKEGVLKG